MSRAHSHALKLNRRKFQRARLRHFFLTYGPNLISGGRLSRRHISQPIITRELTIASPAWPKSLDNFRIAHVSDFHVGELMPVPHALAVIRRLHDLAPDFVACTGDVVDLHNDVASEIFRALAEIRAPLGSALVLGNHDELHCADTISRAATDAGILLLRNATARLAHNGHNLIVSGIDFAKRADKCAELVTTSASEQTHILLAHNPRAFPQAAHLGIPLTLSGHTHGGQIALKNRPNTNLAVGYRHRAGLFSQGNSRLYVTVGVGAWFPLRVNCPGEIAMLTMRHHAA
ncbi:MAG TPA: metallophosphoesterase [Phycisphaerales bacterium]|nr:metallophosphoesterase [Phycisphaerales bacterium]